MQPKAIGKQLQWHDALTLMDIKLIQKLGKNNVVPDALSQKEKYQDERVINATEALKAMFIRESNLDRKLREGYVNDHLAKLMHS